MDEYPDFPSLARVEREGVDYQVRVVAREGARTVILAPHGGGIEPGTSEIAARLAGSDLSLASFEGTKPAGNQRLHVTSARFDEPRCLGLVRAAVYVVAVHGELSAAPIVFLGGRDRSLGERMRDTLRRDGFRVETHEAVDLQGLSTSNICNRGARGKGVQLELSRGLRSRFFESLTAAGRRRPTEALDRFAAAVRDGLRAGGAL